MTVINLLSRLDDTFFQEVLGSEVLATLNYFDNKYLSTQNLHDILTNTYTNSELLQNPVARKHLIMCLRPVELNDLVQVLNITPTGDAYDYVSSLKFKGDLQKRLFDYFEEEILELEVPEFISNKLVQAGYPLYPYQSAVLKKLSAFLHSEQNRALLHMPTGSGKTRTAISYICRYMVENPGKNVVWFANTKELLDQAFDEFEKAWSFLGDRSVNAYKFWDKSTVDLKKVKGSFVVAGLDKTYQALMKDMNMITTFAQTCTLVIMDEAHMAIAPTYKLLIDNMTANDAALIGLSATPGRTWNDRDEDQKLANFFYRQKAKLEIEGYENPVDYLTANGYLAKVINTKLFHTSGITLSKEDMKFLEEHYVLPNKILKAISEDRLRNMTIISRIEQLVKVHQRIILFAITKEHAIVLNSLLTAMGINSRVVTSDTDAVERVNIIKQFKVPRLEEPTPMVLCNYGILTTGFDAPETSCALIARPTDSLVLYSQMVGRAIRGINSGGNETAEIITVIDENLPGFKEVAEAFINWEDVWQ
jgi:DNA repair protein RadD